MLFRLIMSRTRKGKAIGYFDYFPFILPRAERPSDQLVLLRRTVPSCRVPWSGYRSRSLCMIAFGTAHRVSVGMILELQSLPASLLLHTHTYSTAVAACCVTNYTSDNKMNIQISSHETKKYILQSPILHNLAHSRIPHPGYQNEGETLLVKVPPKLNGNQPSFSKWCHLKWTHPLMSIVQCTSWWSMILQVSCRFDRTFWLLKPSLVHILSFPGRTGLYYRWECLFCWKK